MAKVKTRPRDAAPKAQVLNYLSKIARPTRARLAKAKPVLTMIAANVSQNLIFQTILRQKKRFARTFIPGGD